MASKVPRGQTPERRAYMKAWTLAHPRPSRRAYKQQYDAAHREENAAYRERNHDRLTTNKAVWYQENRARLLAKAKSRAAVNRDRILAYQAEYYATHTEKVRATVAAYRLANPEKKRHLENRRRARKAGNGGSHTLQERRAKFAECGNRCAYCHAEKPLTVDHLVPLARGGTDDISNIVPACRSCNSKKNARTAEEFLQSRGQGR